MPSGAALYIRVKSLLLFAARHHDVVADSLPTCCRVGTGSRRTDHCLRATCRRRLLPTTRTNAFLSRVGKHSTQVPVRHTHRLCPKIGLKQMSPSVARQFQSEVV
jgi:hypothetical protein